MTTTTPTPPTSPNFLKAFVPGLVLGLAVGLLAGAYLGGIFEARGGDVPLPRTEGNRTAQPRDRDPAPMPIQPPAQPGDTPASPTPEDAPKPETPKPDAPATGGGF
jgi:hypothetical protein